MDYKSLIADYAPSLMGMASVVSILFWILFITRYFSSQTERTSWTKFFDIIFMFFYMALFALYLAVGAYIGDALFGSSAIGICMGIGAFLVMVEILAYLKKKRTKV